MTWAETGPWPVKDQHWSPHFYPSALLGSLSRASASQLCASRWHCDLITDTSAHPVAVAEKAVNECQAGEDPGADASEDNDKPGRKTSFFSFNPLSHIQLWEFWLDAVSVSRSESAEALGLSSGFRCAFTPQCFLGPPVLSEP